MKAIYIEKTGGPEVLQFGDRPIPEPQKEEVLVKVAVSGVNFTDLNQRSGINKIPVPAVLGSEGAGTVERSESSSFKTGDRVAWCMVRGSYAEYASVPSNFVWKLDARLTFEQGASIGIPYFTAYRALVHKYYNLISIYFPF